MSRRREGGNGAPVTWRDLYTELEKMSSRVGRIEKGMVALAVLVATPKLGGPSASQLVAALIQLVP